MANKKSVASLVDNVKLLDLKDLEAFLIDIKKHATDMRKTSASNKRSDNNATFQRYAREVFLKKVVPNSEKKEGYTLDELKDALLMETKKFAKKKKKPYANISLEMDLRFALPKKFNVDKMKFYYNINSVEKHSFYVAVWYDAGRDGMYYTSFEIRPRGEDYRGCVPRGDLGIKWNAWPHWSKLTYDTGYSSDAKVKRDAEKLYVYKVGC
jgi:hypothetical protein